MINVQTVDRIKSITTETFSKGVLNDSALQTFYVEYTVCL